MEILESQIEDILVNSSLILQNVLNLEDEPRLLVRQMVLPSGRLDLLLAYRTNLLIIELKVVGFQRKFLDQVSRYRDDLLEYQSRGRLLKGAIRPYLLCTSLTERERQMSESIGIVSLDYSPEEVLKYYYTNLKPIAYFSQVKPIDIGIWNIHLIHDFIYLVEGVTSISDLKKAVGGSPKTLYNKIKFAHELRLVDWTPSSDTIRLSTLGLEYVGGKNVVLPERLSENQIDLLRRFVVRNPYESSVILGIASIVEATFFLSKNTYPVLMSHLIDFFSYYAGKYFEWKTPKAKYNATRMYSNYAIDLGLLAKSNDTIYLTPDGFRFTLQMQLHKSIRMAENT